MENKTTEELLKEEKKFIAEARAQLVTPEDKEYFERKLKSLKNGEKLAETEEQKELLLNQYVQTRHQLTFLLFRKRLITDNLTEQFLGMMPIEEANRRYAEKEDERKKRQDEENTRIMALRDEENKLDIFKGVLSGMSEEKAKEELAKYQAEAAKLAGVK